MTRYAVYTPAGSEATLRRLLPTGFRLLLQGDGDLGAWLMQATVDPLGHGHAGAILVNSDSPTLPPAVLRAAVAAVRSGSSFVGGSTPAFATPGLVGAEAPATRQFLAQRDAPLRARSSR